MKAEAIGRKRHLTSSDTNIVPGSVRRHLERTASSARSYAHLYSRHLYCELNTKWTISQKLRTL